MNISIIHPLRHAKTKLRLTACCLLLFALHAYGQTTPPLTLHFYLAGTKVDNAYMDNAVALHRLGELLGDSALAARIDSVNIFSYASPDGGQKQNRRLSHLRSLSVRDYLLRHYPYLNSAAVHPRPQGEDWQEMRRLIAVADSLPCRDKVLQIIDRNPGNDRCKLLLKQLDGGRPYRYLALHVLPLLRNASVCVVYLREPLPGMTPDMMAGLPHENEFPPVTDINITDIYPNGNPAASPCRRRPLFAVKTNLLFDAALMPNIEIEVPIGGGNRWSVNGEWMFPWWQFDKDKYCLQVLMGGVEGRYWLGSRYHRAQREALTGHFLGLYAGGGKYDLQWDANGYQGEFFIAAGVSYGWATRIARRLHLEFNIGIGLLRTNYRHYHARENYQTLLWQENGRYTWLGPTKAKISLVWLLGRKAKKGGAR